MGVGHYFGMLGDGERAAGDSQPMIRYSNDPRLAEIEQQIEGGMRVLRSDLTNGRLDKAFLTAHDMEKNLDKLKQRLNDLKYRG